MDQQVTVVTPEKGWDGWQAIFLERLAASPNVSAACRAAKVSRKHAYATRKADPEFAEAWADAHAESIDELEEIAYVRAKLESDTLTIFLLKSHRPDVYRETVKQEHGGEITIRYVNNWRALGGPEESPKPLEAKGDET